MPVSLLDWLREAFAMFQLEPIALYRASTKHEWPLVARDEESLQRELERGGHFSPLPKEPAALANILEVFVADFVIAKLSSLEGVAVQRGSERHYPDLEVSGELFGGGFHAVDIKVARRGKNGSRTDSRITLYTGNTYFRYPQLHWSGTLRPFDEYVSHLDVVVLYTLDAESLRRARDVEILVQEAWAIGSRQRSSTTREYIGAVNDIAALRSGHGEFETKEEFYAYWRKYGFKIGKAVQQKLDRLLKTQKG